ncbi:MAG: YncE family protein, partial [Alistipes sp.]|nr:YncE family protein [Alistipes sp.]
MSKVIVLVAATLQLLLLSGCMKWETGNEEEFSAEGRGLFITNEGNFQYGNASLSYYNPATCEVENEVFFRS